jgi:N-acetylneuraminic acid mutarotase
VSAQLWEQLENFPGSARDDGSTFTIGENHYCGLGRDVGFNCTRDFFVYNGTSSTWTASVGLPAGEERQYATGASWNNKGIIFGGAKCDGSYLNDIWIFDPLTASWTEKTPLPSDGRGGAVHFLIQDTLYIIGGRNGNGILSEVWGYDLNSDSWSQKTSFPGYGIWRGTAFLWNGIGYAGLGKNNLNLQTGFNTDIYSFDAQNQAWNITPSTGLTPRCYIGTSQVDSLVLLFGGVDETNTILSSFDRLDVFSWTIQSLTSFSSVPRKGVMCFLVDDTFYLTTGVSQTTRFNETWRINGILGNAELSTNSAVLFPNPGTDHCRIQFAQKPIETLTVTTIDGNILQELSNITDTYVDLDLRDLTNGIYIVSCGSMVQRLQVLK